MQSLVCSRNTLPQQLCDNMFRDRKRQFVDRMQWNLRITSDGHEIDEYDDGRSTYLVVHDDHRHLGSCRVRSTQYTTMLTDHFLSSFPDAFHFLRMQRGRVYELTRFCRAPGITALESKTMLANIAMLMDKFRQEKNLTAYVAVVYPKVARFMDTIGMRYLLVSESEIKGERAQLICITEATSTESMASLHQPTVPYSQYQQPLVA